MEEFMLKKTVAKPTMDEIDKLLDMVLSGVKSIESSGDLDENILVKKMKALQLISNSALTASNHVKKYVMSLFGEDLSKIIRFSIRDSNGDKSSYCALLKEKESTYIDTEVLYKNVDLKTFLQIVTASITRTKDVAGQMVCTKCMRVEKNQPTLVFDIDDNVKEYRP